MNITFESEQFGKHEWNEFKPGKIPTTDAEDIEKVTGMTFVEWGQALMNGNTICGRALVWILLRRQNRGLRFREISYPLDALEIGLDEDEKKRLREELMKNDDLDEKDRKDILTALGMSDLEALDFEPEDEDASRGNGSTVENGADSA
jgi:hypothetical protein